MEKQKYLVIAIIVAYTSNFGVEGFNFDPTATDYCTTAFMGCIQQIGTAFGGDDAIVKYKMTVVTGTSADIYGYVVMMKTDYSSMFGRKKRNAAPDANTAALAQMTLVWIQGMVAQTDMCPFIHQMNLDLFYEGQECTRNISDACPSSFGHLNTNYKFVPANTVYYNVRDELCTPACENYVEKYTAISACQFMSSKGSSMVPHILQLQEEITNGSDTTATCTSISSQVDCVISGVGCCNVLSTQFVTTMNLVLKEPYRVRCGITYTNSSCNPTAAPTTMEVTTLVSFNITENGTSTEPVTTEPSPTQGNNGCQHSLHLIAVFAAILLATL